MIQEIKNNEPRERQTYASPSVKVIEVAAQRVLCESGGTQDYDNDNTKWW